MQHDTRQGKDILQPLFPLQEKRLHLFCEREDTKRVALRKRPAVCLVRPSLPQMPQKNAFSKWGLRLRTHIFRWGENMNANRRNALLTIGVGIVLWLLPIPDGVTPLA